MNDGDVEVFLALVERQVREHAKENRVEQPVSHLKDDDLVLHYYDEGGPEMVTAAREKRRMVGESDVSVCRAGCVGRPTGPGRLPWPRADRRQSEE